MEGRLQDIHISGQIDIPDKQKGDGRQIVVHRIVCAYHPGVVREKVLRAQNVIYNTDSLTSDSHAASYMSRPLGVFHQQDILQSRTLKTI